MYAHGKHVCLLRLTANNESSHALFFLVSAPNFSAKGSPASSPSVRLPACLYQFFKMLFPLIELVFSLSVLKKLR
jgi:hypothetical protein